MVNREQEEKSRLWTNPEMQESNDDSWILEEIETEYGTKVIATQRGENVEFHVNWEENDEQFRQSRHFRDLVFVQPRQSDIVSKYPVWAYKATNDLNDQIFPFKYIIIWVNLTKQISKLYWHEFIAFTKRIEISDIGVNNEMMLKFRGFWCFGKVDSEDTMSDFTLNIVTVTNMISLLHYLTVKHTNDTPQDIVQSFNKKLRSMKILKIIQLLNFAKIIEMAHERIVN